MISFPRALARAVRAVLRRSVVDQEPRGEWPLLVCRAGPAGLTLEAQRGAVAVRYHLPGSRPEAALAFRASALAGFEGRGADGVTLEPVGPGTARASWREAGVPRVMDVDTVDPAGVPPPPPPPARWAPQPDGFRQALLGAAGTAAREASRFALARVQLRGRAGQVVATDGRQLLLRGGFRLPWAEDLLVPPLPALGLRELRGAGPVAVGRAGDHVALRLGPWTFFLGVDPTGRFPDVRAVVPGPGTATARLRLDPADAAFLAASVPGLPGATDEHAPVTLDLGPRAVVRARGAGESRSTELELVRSTVEGKPARLALNRLYLRRALALGFRELEVGPSGQPATWRAGEDVYLAVPLDLGAALAPGGDPVRVPSTQEVPLPAPVAHAIPDPERRDEPMPETPRNGHTPEGPPDPAAGLEELIAETEGLRRALQEAAGRAGRLAAALRQQRRQSRAVQAAVQALRGLQLGR